MLPSALVRTPSMSTPDPPSCIRAKAAASAAANPVLSPRRLSLVILSIARRSAESRPADSPKKLSCCRRSSACASASLVRADCGSRNWPPVRRSVRRVSIACSIVDISRAGTFTLVRSGKVKSVTALLPAASAWLDISARSACWLRRSSSFDSRSSAAELANCSLIAVFNPVF